MTRSFKRSLGVTSLFFIFAAKSMAYEYFPNIPGRDLIYGNDDRVEIDQYEDSSIVEKSQSVAIRVLKKRLTVDRNDPTRILFPLIFLKNLAPQLCEDEKFINQVSLGTCSGFLVGAKTLVTAGHCLLNEKECTTNSWVFGFKNDITALHADQVYSCKKIISQRYVYNENEVSDYAVIELDREVIGYKPLKSRKYGRVRINTPLVVVGHPLGLPMKATDGGVVSRFNDIEKETKFKSFRLRSHYFTANLDAYGGNSGSPVFNKRNGNVEGVLIQGADDFVYNPNKECLQSQRRSDSHLETYEKVMRINKIPGL